MKQVTKYLLLFFIISIVSSHIYFKYLESNLTSEQIEEYESYVSSSKVGIIDEATIFMAKPIVSMNFSQASEISLFLFISYCIVFLCMIYVLTIERKAKGHITLFPVQDKYILIYTIFVLAPILQWIYFMLGGLLFIFVPYQLIHGVTLLTATTLIIAIIYIAKRRKKEIRIGKITWGLIVLVYLLCGLSLAYLILSNM